MAPLPMDVDTADDGRPRLAQELLDLILDHLHYDPGSLKRCALTSQALLPTCQRHLFSTFQITKSNVEKLADLFTHPTSIDDHDEYATLRARVADLLDTYTTELILTDHPNLVSKSAIKRARLPEFENLQKITFKGNELDSDVTIPSFLEQAWMSPSSKIRSVEFDFRDMDNRGVLRSLCVLPPTVENVSFTCATAKSGRHFSAASIREDKWVRILPGRSYQGVHQFNGTMKLRLAPDASHKLLISVMLELGELFKFRFERINYRLTHRGDIHQLTSLVYECKDTLQSLDIMVPSSRTCRA